MGWNRGDEGRIKATFTDTETGNPVTWDNTDAEVTVKPPGEAEGSIESDTAEGGKVSALYLFDKGGLYTGHIILTGEYKRRLPWRLQVGDT